MVAGEGVFYVSDGLDGFKIIDSSNPARPHRFRKKSYETSDSVRGVALSNGYAYVTGGGLDIIDVTDPNAPWRVGHSDTTGYTSDIVVSGDYAYVSSNAGLNVIDVSIPSEPSRLDTDELEARDVAVSGGYAYLASGKAGLKVLDLANPADPRVLGEYVTDGYAQTLTVSGTYAYVAKHSRGMDMIDVSDPNDPVRVSTTEGRARDVAVADGYAYVAAGSDGFDVFDVSDPA